MNVYGETDVGKTRSENQDTIQHEALEAGTLVVVADGMGGHSGGAVASKIAATEFVDRVKEQEQSEQIERVLKETVLEAHRCVRERAEAEPTLSDMGTTLVAAYLVDQTDDEPATATIVNVGDSRAYHVDDEIEQVTVDHSLVQDLVEAGEVDPDDADEHPHGNILSQALGVTEEPEPDVETVKLTGTLVLCSDGLTDELDDEEIALITEEYDVTAGANHLIDRANEAGGRDNISVVLATSSAPHDASS